MAAGRGASCPPPAASPWPLALHLLHLLELPPVVAMVVLRLDARPLHLSSDAIDRVENAVHLAREIAVHRVGEMDGTARALGGRVMPETDGAGPPRYDGVPARATARAAGHRRRGATARSCRGSPSPIARGHLQLVARGAATVGGPTRHHPPGGPRAPPPPRRRAAATAQLQLPVQLTLPYSQPLRWRQACRRRRRSRRCHCNSADNWRRRRPFSASGSRQCGRR